MQNTNQKHCIFDTSCNILHISYKIPNNLGMILEFSIENFRSFKENHTFSLIAESSKSKSDNVFEQQISNGDSIRLLKSAVIYGPNASGKSNLLKAIYNLKALTRSLAQAGEPIQHYDPFLFDVDTREQPTSFSLTFLGPKSHKYVYNIKYNKSEILVENLDYYPKGQPRNLFKRSIKEPSGQLIHYAILGIDYNKREFKVVKNQTILSKFGSEEPDEFLTLIYLYFKENLQIIGNNDLNTLRDIVEPRLHESLLLRQRLERLIKVADTKIEGIVIKKENEFTKNSGSRYHSMGLHNRYKDNIRVHTDELSFDEESRGTNVLFVLGTLVLEILERGGVFLIDEIDTSLHPKLAKFLVLLFKHPISNPKNAQLIFTTHETTFLDKDIFRKDQIWFTEKNKFGASEMFSVQDFENVREDTPFEKWYLAGKFGGIPEIKEIEFIFREE